MNVCASRALLAVAPLFLAACAGGPPPTYAHPPKPEHGAAPGMKAQRLSDDGHGRRYALVFAPGDEILSGLTEFAEREHLGAAQITGIGGVHDAVLGFFDEDRKLFREIPIATQAEVTSLIGDVALLDDHPSVHCHMNVGLPDGSTRGGHLLKAHVSPTLEVIVTESPRALHKAHDEAKGLDLIVIPEEVNGP